MKTHAPSSLRYPLASATLAALMLAVASSSHAQQNIYWDGNGTSSQSPSTAWNISQNWTNNSADTVNASGNNTLPTSADTVIFNVPGINSDQSFNLNGNRTVAGMEISSTGNTTMYSHASAQTNFILTFGSGGLTINSGSGNFTTVSNATTGFLSYRIAANQSWTNNSNNLVTMNGGISNSGNATAFVLTFAGSGSGGMTQTGPISDGGTVGKVGLAINNTGGGITTLSGTNTFTGGTTVSAGTVRINNAVALGASASAVNVASGAAIDLNGITMTNANALTLNGTGISSGGALRNGSATNSTYAGLVSLGSDSSIIAATGNITLSSNNGGTITGSGFGLTVGGARNTIISSVIGTGTGGITKQDAGALTLSGGSQSKTATSVASGNTTIPMADTTRIFIGQTVTGGNISAGSYITAITANTSITISQAVSGGPSATNLTIAGSTYSGGTNVTGGTLLLGSSSSFSGPGMVSSGPTGTGNVSFSNGTTLAASSGTGQSLYAPTINIGGNITIGGSTTTTGRISLAGTIDLGNGNRTITLGKASTNYSSGSEVLRLEGVSGFAAANIIQNGSLLFTTTTGNATNPSIVRSGSSSVVNFANNLALTLDDGVAYSSGVSNTFGAGANAPALTLNAAVTRGGGVLQMGDGGATVRSAEVYSLAGGGTVSASNSSSGSGTLTINNGNNATFSGVIQGGAGIGAIAVTKSGPGTQTLSGNNTYTLLTTVSAGTLRLGHANALGATTGGTTVSGNGTIGGVLDLNGQAVGGEALSLSGVGIGSSGALVNTSATSASLGGVVTLAANTSIGAGNITLGNVAETGGSRSLTKVGTGTLVLSGTNSYTGGTTVADGTLEISGGNAAPGSFTIGASLPNAVLKLSNTAALATSATLAGVGSNTNTGTFDLAAAGNYTVGSYNKGHMRFTASSGNATTLNFTNPSVLTDSNNTGRTLTNADGNLTIVFGSTFDISSSTAGGGLTVAGPGNTTFNGAIFNSANQSRTLDKSGAGTLTLNGDNNYQGATTIGGSGRVLVNGNTTASTGAVNVSSSATLGGSGIVGGAVNLASTASIGSATNTLTLASTLGVSGNNTLNASSTVNVTGLTTVNAGGTFNVNGTLGGSGDLTLASSNNATANFSAAGVSLDVVTNGSTATNALNFTASTGAVTLASLSGAGNTRFGSDGIVTGGISSGTVTSVGALTADISGGTVSAGSLSSSSVTGGTTTVGGVATIGTMSAGTANLNGATSAITTLTGGTINLGSTTVLSVSDGTTSGSINGTGGALTKVSAGTLTLSGTNGYTGATTVSEGTLIVSGSIASTVTTVAPGAVLTFTGSSSAGNITIGSGATFALGTAGTAGAVTINDGTFSGSGTVGSLTFTGSSVFGPGNSPGTVTIADGGTLTMSIGTVSNFEITSPGFGAGTYDLVTGTVGGSPESVVFNGTLNLIFSGSGYSVSATAVKLFDVDSYSGAFTLVNVSGLDTGLVATFDSSTGYVAIAPIPEPSGYAALAGVGMIGFALYRRRRQQKAAVAA